MDVFGNLQNLELEIHDNPGETLDPAEVEQLHGVADSAFDKEGVPEKSDTEDHIIGHANTLVAAKADDEYIAFSSTSDLEDTVYEVGIAVTEEFQQNGLGGLLLSRSLDEEVDAEDIFTYRTQNPSMYGLADSMFEVFPQPEKETPEHLIRKVEDVADALGAEEIDGHVEKEAYGEDYGSMYEQLPEGETRDFLEEDLGMRPYEGDAVIVAAEIDEEQVEDQYLSAVEEVENQYGLEVEESHR